MRLELAGDGLALHLALMADAENAQAVMRGLELEFMGDFVLFAFDYFTEKLDQFAALRTNQMIVMLMVVAVLIPRVAISKAFLPREAAFREELECAVDGCITNRRVFSFDEAV